MSIASEITRIQGAKSALKTAIEGKGVAVPDNATIDAYPALVDEIQQGGGALTEADINFYDYEGSLVDAWTLEELASKTSLPTPPTHNGLTFQGWNWTLADIKSEGIKMNVGAHYITDDGKTRLYITIPDYATATQRVVPFIYTQNSPNSVVVDWGDGSPSESSATTGRVELSHAYASGGNYIIAVSVAQGTSWALGATLQNMFGNANNIYTLASSYLRHVQIGYYSVQLGGGITNSMAFKALPLLETLTMPSNMIIGNQNLDLLESLKCLVVANGNTAIGQYVAQSLRSCLHICVPKTLTTIVVSNSAYTSLTMPKNAVTMNITNAFNLREIEVFNATCAFSKCASLRKIKGVNFKFVSQGLTTLDTLESIEGSYTFASSNVNNAVVSCYALRSFTIPSDATTFANSLLNSCTSIESVDVPASITSFGNYTFTELRNCHRIRFNRTTPPTFTATGCFGNLPTFCIISVPVGSLNAYKTAANYPNPNNYTYIEE